MLLTADCGRLRARQLSRRVPQKGRALAIACPKLDEGQEEYIEKIRAWFDEAAINTLTVMLMEVPCCGGLLALAKEAASRAKRRVPIKYIVVNLQGEILQEAWA